jgi:hypothetical protein
MAQDQREMLEFLNFELKFLEDGGYGRSPRTPWRARNAFEDSPSCLKFADPDKPHSCSECWLSSSFPRSKGTRMRCAVLFR